ncbi:hypothetical protein N782_19620 [Pontibacillus yanchengensis Y32]|uniref:Uncharacterized protein n=2 Tax=Pontibacillus yanchengensis TaxID=462910 RepID=A0A0A2TAG0_9BACI|nr:hypothetical protein N782_19620 [Pontibacillus yanchengensis Y32]
MMSFKKQALIMTGNAVLGLISCYLYLYFWVAFSFGSSMITIEAALSMIIPLTLFGVFNAFVLSREERTEWIYAVSTYVGTILLFVIIFAMT